MKKKSVNTSKAKRQLDMRIAAYEEASQHDDKPSLLTRIRHMSRRTMLYAGGAILGLLVVVWLVQAATAPRKGPYGYGLCRIFLELNVQFPDTLRIGTVEVFSDSVRIWHTQIDGFGSYRNEPLQCYFRKDGKQGLMLARVTINRREVDSATIERFNRSLPVFKTYAPDLTLPYDLPNSLRGLKFETDMFRQPLFGPEKKR